MSGGLKKGMPAFAKPDTKKRYCGRYNMLHGERKYRHSNPALTFAINCCGMSTGQEWPMAWKYASLMSIAWYWKHSGQLLHHPIRSRKLICLQYPMLFLPNCRGGRRRDF